MLMSQSPNPRKYFVVPVVAGLLFAMGFYLGHQANPWEVSSDEKTEVMKLNSVLNYIESNYVDEVERSKLVDKSIIAMLEELDPHSSYIPAEDLPEYRERLQGRFEGIGVRFLIHRDTLVVTHVIPGGPSHITGLVAGDRIVKVDKEEITDGKLDNEKVQKLLKGNSGTPVQLMVKRSDGVHGFRIIRGPVVVSSVDAALMLEGSVAYIRINTFGEHTYEEFMTVARQLRRKGMTKLILDLRDNGGGYLTAATDIVDEFLPEGKLIVYTQGNARDRSSTFSRKDGTLMDVELAVLINESSASASEIVAGALQDHDRATIIGRRSFGKGLVQEQHEWADGSAIRLTIARYYTPTGRSIQRPYGKDVDYEKDFYDRFENGELYEVDSSLFVDSLKYTTPGGKTVYGGGGIMPDIFVPVDSSGSSHYLSSLRYFDVFSHLAVDYVDMRREELDKMGYRDFVQSFNPETLLEELMRMAEEEFKLARRPPQFQHSLARIKVHITAAICRQIWLEDGAMYAYYPHDHEVQKAIEVLSGGTLK
jgi:carboxyl-terminal processing protease